MKRYTHQAESGTKVVLDAIGCDQTCHHYSVIMGSGRLSLLTDLGQRLALRHVLGVTICATPWPYDVVMGFKLVVRAEAQTVLPAIDA